MSKSSATSGEAKSASKKPTTKETAKRSTKTTEKKPTTTARKTKTASTRKTVAPPRRQALVILGMHRSGTSALTGVLERLGAVGPDTKLPPNEFNVKGYGESRVFMQLHDRLLESAGSRWDDWSRFNPAWQKSAIAARFGAEIRDAVTSEYDGEDFFVVKDPRVCRFAGFWLQTVDAMEIDLKTVLIVRNPLEVARSLTRRDGMSLQAGLLLWLRHVLDAEEASRSRTRVVVSYAGLLQDWRKLVSQFEDRMGVSFPRQSASMELEVDEFLESALRHQVVSDDEVYSSAVVQPWVAETFRILMGATARGELSVVEQARLDTIRTEFNAASKVFAPITLMATNEAAQSRRSVDEAKARTDKLEAELAEARQGLEALRAERANASETVEALKAERSRLQIAELEAVKSRDDVQRLLEAERQAHSKTRSESEAALERLRNEAQASEASLTAKLEQNKAEVEALEAVRTELASAREALAEHAEKLTQRDQTIQALENELQEKTRLHEEMVHRQGEQSEQRATLEAVRAEKAELDRRIEAYQARVTTLEQESASLTRDLRDAQEAAQRAEANAVRRLPRDVSAEPGEVERALASESERLNAKLSELRTKLAESEDRERNLQRRLFAREEQLRFDQKADDVQARFERQVSDLTRERDHWADQASRASERARAAGEERDTFRSLTDKQSRDIDRLGDQVAELKRQMVLTLEHLQGNRPVQDAMRKQMSVAAFDSAFYARALQNLGLDAPKDALGHFINVGVHAGINPHPLFDVQWYLEQNPDVRKAGLNPLHHYLRNGDKEGRSPHPLFDARYYREQNPDVAAAGVNALCHYLSGGCREARDPNPWFYSAWYVDQNKDVAEAGLCPLLHYAVHGESENRKPHPSFDTAWYRKTHLGNDQKISPLAYHLTVGRHRRMATRSGIVDGPVDTRITILAVAHSAGEHLFGSERSFYDVVSSIDREKYRVLVVLPAPSSAYVDLMSGVCDQVHFIRRAWWEQGRGDRPDVLARYRDLIKNEGVDIVYANTIMLSEPMLAARERGITSVCHVREAIVSDPDLRELVGKSANDIIADVCGRSDFIIANSQHTGDQFTAPGRTFQIYNAVDVDKFDMAAPDREEGPLVIGMLSSNIPKKGLADAVDMARAADKAGLDIRVRLIGPETAEVKRLQKAIKGTRLETMVEFPGYAADISAAMSGLDVVINFSHFAESFGRTVAEAFAARRPVIVYDHGALPELVVPGENGYVIPYKQPLAALEHLRMWNDDRARLRQMGEKARERAVELFSTEVLADKVNAALDKILAETGHGDRIAPSVTSDLRRVSTPAGTAPVSVIIPNYNYENHLPERINSILRQTVKPAEIIFLDDVSKDRSVEVAREILEKQDIPFQIVTNETNKGVYKQWLTGFSLASQPWVWVAEADDSCEPDFLETLLGYAHDDVNLIYAQSKKIDGEGNTTAEDNRAHSNDISKTRWNQDYIELGVREVADALAYRNTIPNGSAALLRKSAIAGFEDTLKNMRFTGDWLLYCHLLRTGKVAFVARPLNHFRRHAQTVTSTQGKTVDYLIELAWIREYFTRNFPILPAQIERMNWFLDRDYKIEGVPKNSAEPQIADSLKRAEENTLNRARIAFITTNNGSFYGGSEMLWRETALELRERGHDVFALIKRWEPRPDFFDAFEAAGVKLLFKDEDGFDALLDRKPDLTIVSIGDQDEGIEYYSRLTEAGLPYVIVNQLTKEARVWPVRKERTPAVRDGYAGARTAFFTCWNNHRVMESRLGSKIPNADMHFNPYHIDRTIVPDWPDQSEGLQVAIPSKLLFIHKGQDLLAEVAAKPAWKERKITFNFFGIGPDEERLKEMAEKAGIENFRFHGRVDDISVIWRDNHALLMPSRMEGLPIMLISAMLSARVPILTDVGGHAEVVQDNASGFIAANPSVEDLEDALERAWAQRENWQEIGQLARQHVLDFLPENPVDDFIQKLEALMQGEHLRAVS